MQVLQAAGLWDSVSRRNRSVSHSYRPYRTVSHRYRTVSHRNRLVSRRIAPYRTRIASSRTGSLRLARIVSHRNRIVSLGSSRVVASLKFYFAPVWKFFCFLHSLQAKVPYSLSNLTPVRVGVLLGLCSTPGPPWCPLAFTDRWLPCGIRGLAS